MPESGTERKAGGKSTENLKGAHTPMKQGNNCLLPIRVSGIDPGLVESIQLKFQQGEVVRKVAYPSDEATLKGNIVYVT